MKILEINKFCHLRGGADKHFLDLVSLLEKNGHEVAIFAMEHPRNPDSRWKKYFVGRVDYDNGNFFNKLKGALRVFWSLEAKRKISRLLDDFKPDVAHIHNIYHQISPSILPEIKKRGIPIVMTVHDWKLICPNYLLNCSEPYCRKCVAGKYWHCVANKCVKNSYIKSLICTLELYFHKWLKIYEKNVDLFIAPSEFAKNILVEAGFPEKKIAVLPHFVEVKPLRNQRQLPAEDYAFYFGRLSKEKGVDELIDVFKDLPVNLVLAGRKDKDFAIPNRSNVRYLGFKSVEEIEKLVQNSKFVVSASRLPETFGLIALETVRRDKPFLGYKAGAYGEIVENGVSGWLAETREEFHTKAAEFAGGNMPKFAFKSENFSPESYHKKILDIFRSVC